MEIDWDVIETENFVRSCENNDVSQDVVNSLRVWAKSVRRQIGKNQKNGTSIFLN